MAKSKSRQRRRTPQDYNRFRPAYALLAGATAIASAVVATSLTWPEAGMLPALAASHERNADAALKTTPPDYDVAQIENAAALSSAPRTVTAWVRKAYIRRSQSSGLDTEALDSLEASYRAAPFGPDVTRWRMRFMFENWSSLTPSLRERAVAELEVFARFHKGSYAFARSIRDPSGRLAATLTARRTYRQIGNSAS